MTPKSTRYLPCAVFGHNYVKSKTNVNQSTELICVHCETVVNTDSKGNFETNTVVNPEIKEAIQRLYRLNRRSKTKVA